MDVLFHLQQVMVFGSFSYSSAFSQSGRQFNVFCTESGVLEAVGSEGAQKNMRTYHQNPSQVVVCIGRF